jgi:hypothetical protein
MGSTITVNDRPHFAVCDNLQCCIYHGVGETRIRFGPDSATDDHAVEAINDRRDVNFARAYMEHGDVDQPFFIWRRGLEVAVNDVLRRRAYLTQI